jgi:ABC-2 type transport system permease protein
MPPSSPHGSPNSMLQTAVLIAKREYLERIRSKAFRISTVLMPLLFAAIFGVGAFSATHLSSGSHIVIASNDPALAASVRDELVSLKKSPPQVEVMAPATETDLDSLARRVEDKQIDGYLWLQSKPGDVQPTAVYASRSSTDLSGQGRMQDAIGHAVLRTQLKQRGMAGADMDKLLNPVDIKTVQVKNGRAIASNSENNFWAAYAMMFLLYFSVSFYGLNVGRSVIEEKTSRIFEVLLSSVKAESLMIGKLLGVGAAALTQLGIWFSILAFYAGSQVAANSGIHGIASLGIQPVQLIFFVVYFILGFLFYSALSCGLGATMSTEQEMNQFAIIILLPLILSSTMFTYVLFNPSAPLSVALSLFPPCTPIIMCLRMAAQMPPLSQLIASVVLMLLSIYLVLWLASRVYRIGILMYGKRPNLPEMIRWMRYS